MCLRESYSDTGWVKTRYPEEGEPGYLSVVDDTLNLYNFSYMDSCYYDDWGFPYDTIGNVIILQYELLEITIKNLIGKVIAEYKFYGTLLI